MEKNKEIKWENIGLVADNEVDNHARWFAIKGVDGRLLMPNYWDIHVDLENMRYTFNDCDYPTLNDLNHPYDSVKLCYPYNECDIDFDYYPEDIDEYGFDIDFVLDTFSDNGFNVTEEAVMHNFNAWYNDFKSGYRDDENGYHLFTPCGCNHLSFRCTSLHETAKDWQTTYKC